MKVLKYLSIVFAGIFLFIACEKEFSIESGYAGKVATGSLMRDSLGNCSNVTARGVYMVDSTLSDSNYVTVQVNFATGGSYRIFTDTQNGFSFQDSGFIGAGLQTIKLKASGKPILAKQTTFQVAFDTTFCSFTVNVIANSPAVYTFISTGPDCANPTIDGTYIAGQPLTSANTVTLEVDVTVTGGYSITTAPVNGMTFSGTGNLTTPGLQIITLQGSGVPTTAGKNTIPISTGTSNCSFSISVVAGTPGGGNTDPNASDTAWQFTQGANTFKGPFFDVHDTTQNNVYGIVFIGIVPATADTAVFFGTVFPGSTIQTGDYNTQTSAFFSFVDTRDTAHPIYDANYLTPTVNTKLTISSYDPTTRIITGTFTGTALNASNVSVPITNGKFKAKVRKT